MNLAKEMEKQQWVVVSFVTTYDNFVKSGLSMLREREREREKF